ncbi:MAG: hypothetical protein HC822_11410 [Oscillochloris sp.]|nr:hypothetical protein [Oscillochloris sp.]
MSVIRLVSLVLVVLAAALAPALANPTQADTQQIATVQVTAQEIRISPLVAYGAARLRVQYPDGTLRSFVFAPGEAIRFTIEQTVGAGSYSYELRLSPLLSAADQQRVDAVRPGEREAITQALIAEGKLPALNRSASGTLQVQNGAFLLPQLEVVQTTPAPGASKPGSGAAPAPDDVVTPDDQIVQGSLCVGLDCINNEGFGFDTIRLKENNTRIAFEDTSVGSFPSNDWQIIANDSASGGANYLAIEDRSGARIPFRVEAGARTNGLVLDETRVGFGVINPARELHIAAGNSPTIRLDQDGSSIFGAYVWDVGGNEENFFVRDVNNGDQLPFRIRAARRIARSILQPAGMSGSGWPIPRSACM